MDGIYPRMFKRYALRHVDTQHGLVRAIRAMWLLDVAGPFCQWPQYNTTQTGARREQLANSLSNLLGYSVAHSGNSIEYRLQVVISAEERARIFREEYQRDTRSGSHS